MKRLPNTYLLSKRMLFCARTRAVFYVFLLQWVEIFSVMIFLFICKSHEWKNVVVKKLLCMKIRLFVKLDFSKIKYRWIARVSYFRNYFSPLSCYKTNHEKIGPWTIGPIDPGFFSFSLPSLTIHS